MSRFPLRWCVVLLLPVLLALAGCDHGVGDRASPAAALQANVDTLRQGQLGRFCRQALPPQDYALLRADWVGGQLLTDTRRVDIERALQDLAAADASTTAKTRWLAEWAHAGDTYGDQLPFLLHLGQSLMDRRVASTSALDPAQKQQATAILAALMRWAQRAPWFDPQRASRAIDVAAETARQLRAAGGLPLPSRDFDAAMQTSTIALGGLRRMLAIYGLSLEATLDSVRITPLAEAGDHATVRLDYTVLQTPLSARVTMVRIDGRWYSQGLIDAVRRLHAATATSTPAPATSADAGAVALAGLPLE